MSALANRQSRRGQASGQGALYAGIRRCAFIGLGVASDWGLPVAGCGHRKMECPPAAMLSEGIRGAFGLAAIGARRPFCRAGRGGKRFFSSGSAISASLRGKPEFTGNARTPAGAGITDKYQNHTTGNAAGTGGGVAVTGRRRSRGPFRPKEGFGRRARRPGDECRAVPVKEEVPADGDIAAGGGGLVVAGRLSLEGGSFPVG